MPEPSPKSILRARSMKTLSRFQYTTYRQQYLRRALGDICPIRLVDRDYLWENGFDLVDAIGV